MAWRSLVSPQLAAQQVAPLQVSLWQVATLPQPWVAWPGAPPRVMARWLQTAWLQM